MTPAPSAIARSIETGKKVSVNLPAEDIEFLDAYAERRGLPSRSAVVHQAVRLLRASELVGGYESAWQEWSISGDEELWQAVTSDGLT